jgi:2-deoxy-D-gluconate 3-dehydrogenase
VLLPVFAHRQTGVSFMSILELFRLDGKVALVTGSSRGIGQAMAVALAEAGADIVGVSSSGDQPETAARVAATGRTFTPLRLNLGEADASALRGLVEMAAARAGRLDILVNNAGTTHRAPILDFAEAHWDEVLQVNLKAAFFLAQAAARVMVAAGGGKIINTASLLSFQGGILVPAYAASKHGVMGITRALANELAARGVNVNGIAPGYIATDLTSALQADETRNRAILERIPAGRWGTPDDLKGAVVFLASRAADYLHGEIITVDGGWMSR